MRTLALGLALVVLVLKAAAPIHAEPGIFESFWGSYVALGENAGRTERSRICVGPDC
jgi:hypothetical protein